VAAVNGSELELRSVAYGSAAFVDVETLEEGAGGGFNAGLSASRDEGTDVVATVNGVTANGAGNTLSVNTSTLDLALTVSDGSSTDVSFTINGGGAVFQLGPQVVSNQQARIAITSVNTGELGGVDGRLYQLRSGNNSDLATDPHTATLIVDQAINRVTSLRGRLGAFQRTTLETNIAALSDTITNLTDAESSIRDADFAAETARLTRAQILVQSGTQVLAIANQNPQNVLALLRG
jgi:flagellin